MERSLLYINYKEVDHWPPISSRCMVKVPLLIQQVPLQPVRGFSWSQNESCLPNDELTLKPSSCIEFDDISYSMVIRLDYKKITVPYMGEQWKKHGLLKDRPSLVIVDIFQGQCTATVNTILQENNIIKYYVQYFPTTTLNKFAATCETHVHDKQFLLLHHAVLSCIYNCYCMYACVYCTSCTCSGHASVFGIVARWCCTCASWLYELPSALGSQHKSAKEFLTKEFQNWYAQQLCNEKLMNLCA